MLLVASCNKIFSPYPSPNLLPQTSTNVPKGFTAACQGYRFASMRRGPTRASTPTAQSLSRGCPLSPPGMHRCPGAPSEWTSSRGDSWRAVAISGPLRTSEAGVRAGVLRDTGTTRHPGCAMVRILVSYIHACTTFNPLQPEFCFPSIFET